MTKLYSFVKKVKLQRNIETFISRFSIKEMQVTRLTNYITTNTQYHLLAKFYLSSV